MDLGPSTASDDAGSSTAETPRRTCLLVLGMHRSGTSALARVLSLMGAALPKNLMGPGPGNETGHWEPAQIVQLHDHLLEELGSPWDDWNRIDVAALPPERLARYQSELRRLLREDYGDASLFVLKDPRVSRFVPLLRDVVAAEGIALKAVLVVRNPLEVIDSLERRRETWAQDYTRADAALLWLRHMLDAEAASRDVTRAVVSYDGLMRDWRSSVGRLTGRLDVPWRYDRDEVAGLIESFLTPLQRHHARSTEDVRLDPMMQTWIGDSYEALLVLESAPESPAALRILDRVRREFDHAAPVLRRLVAEVRERHRAEAAGLAETVATREAEAASLRSELSIAHGHALSTATALREHQEKMAELDAARVRAETAKAQAHEQQLAAQANLQRDHSAQMEVAGRQLAEAAANAKGRDIQLKELSQVAESASSRAEEHAERVQQLTDELVSERGWRSVNEPKLHHVEAEVTRLSGIEKSTSWRATAGFRCAAHRLPKSVRQNARRVLKAAWWAATPLEIPARLRERSHRTQSLLKPEMPAITGLRQVVRRAFDARRDLGSWRNVATRAQQHLAAKGAMGTLSDLAIPPALPYVASLVDGSDARQSPIRRRYNSIRSETTVRLTTKSTSRSVNASGPTISILMPVYKVKLSYLERTIESVLRQAYERWELCIVDDCSNSPAIDMCLQRYAALDPRIKLFQSPTNIGISAATNRALAMATGDFCCLVDHDDLLTNDALDCVAGAVLSTPALDIIYSDECKIGESDEADELYFKPDWDKYLLDNVMFTGHLSTYRTALVRDLGGFRSEYDLSQDYDLALRATERTESIFHIPRILYGWRKHPNSAASGGKPEARLTNIAALQDAANRRGYNARAVALPTANRLVRDRTSFKQSVSIIIPSDNASFIRKSVDSITLSTTFQNYDIIVVTSTKLISALTSDCAFDHRVKFSAYDAAFNFSEKCNVGARASSADILIFYNDDVRVISSDWIECLLDYLALDEVGICGPKLLYENETIQHAGMVTGVRQLVGTAFHSLPRGTPYYYNFAQSVRTTSLICGACLAIKRTLFEDIGGYDSERFPIAHSDVDLCFKARKAGASCVYTPHAELFHIGHVSIGKTDEAEKAQPIRKDKAEINTLKLWPDYIASDPFFTESMAGILYHDSPEYYRILPPTKGLTLARFAMDYILVFHDLSNSGAPRGLFECARHLIDAGHFVVAVSPTTGPYEAKLRALGAFVIVDELLFSRHPSVFKFCTNFDVMIANTVVAWPIVEQCAGSMPCFWYVHETGLVSDLASQNIDVIQAFKVAAQVWVAGKRGQAAVQVLRPDVRIVEYGFELPPMEPRYVVQDDSSVIRVAVVGSIEPRKGQDLAIAALRRLPDDVNQMFSLNIYGRTLDKIFEADIRRLSENMGNVHFHGEVSTERALLEISRSHILLVPSRDEPFSIVGLDAMAREVVVICGPEVGLHDYLTDSVNALLVKSSAPEDLALGLVRALALRSRLRTIGQAARTLYEEIFSDVAFKKRVLAILEVSGVRE